MHRNPQQGQIEDSEQILNNISSR